jgi:hypothetical protein
MIGDNGTIQEGRAAAYMGQKPVDNPYRRYMQRTNLNDEAYGRYAELRNAWDSGYASCPATKRGTVS